MTIMAMSLAKLLGKAAPTSAKTSQELKSQLCLSAIPARCTCDIIATTRIRWLLMNSPNHNSFLLGVLTALAAARPYCESSQKRALNLFGRLIELVYQTAARLLPMYITKNTRHPPHRQHFWEFFPNLGEGLSSRPTR